MLPRTSLIDLLDDACQQAVAAQRTGRRLSALRLPPVMFELVKHEKARDFAFGNSFMLLGLPVVEDPELRPDQVELT
jgi:hypothetical protein